MKKTMLVATAIACALLFAGCGGKKNKDVGTELTGLSKEAAKEVKGLLKKAAKLKPNPASDFRYTLADDGKTVVIQEYVGKKDAKSVVFPAEIEGMPVSGVCVLSKPVLSEGDAVEWDENGLPSVNKRKAQEIYERQLQKTYKIIVVPEGVTTLPKNFARRCTALSFVSLPKTLVSIGEDAFFGCTSLKAIEIPNSVKTIGAEAFLGSKLESLSLPEKLETIGGGAFRGCPFTTIEFPATIKEIGGGAFYNTGLTKVSIPEGFETIGGEFGGKNLKSISFPSTLKNIKENAFKDCSNLEEVIVPDSIESVLFFKYETENYLETNPGHGYISRSRTVMKDMHGKNGAFVGTHLNLQSQAAVKRIGYEGKF